MVSWLLLSALSAAPVSLGAPRFQLIDVEEKQGDWLSETFAQQLAQQGVAVTTNSQLVALIGFERQKQLLGCTDATGCMTELANALGVDGIITGTVARFGEFLQVNVKIIAAGGSKPLALWSARLRDEEALFDAMRAAAPRIVHDVRVSLGREVAGARPWWLLPAGLAVALGVSSGVLFGVAGGRVATLETGTLSGNVRDFADQTRTLQSLAVGLAIAAGVSALTAGGFGLFGRDVQPVAFVGPAQSGVGLVGVFP
jgi:TolB-like protein